MSANEFAPSVSKKLSGSMPVAKSPIGDDADDDDDEERDEGSDPADDHEVDSSWVRGTQLYGTLTARLRRAISSAFIPSGSMASATRTGGGRRLLGPIEAPGQVRIRAGVAGQRLGDLLGHEVRAQQRPMSTTGSCR